MSRIYSLENMPQGEHRRMITTEHPCSSFILFVLVISQITINDSVAVGNRYKLPGNSAIR